MNKVTFAASSIMNQKSSTASQIAVVHLSGSSNPSATNNGSGHKTNSSSATTTIGNGAINYNNHGSAAAPAAATTTSISTGAASAANNSSAIVGFKGGNSVNRGPGIPPKPSLINGYERISKRRSVREKCLHQSEYPQWPVQATGQSNDNGQRQVNGLGLTSAT